jgi:hypothetical protein
MAPQPHPESIVSGAARAHEIDVGIASARSIEVGRIPGSALDAQFVSHQNAFGRPLVRAARRGSKTTTTKVRK